MDRLLTQREVAEYVHRPLATVRYWRYQNIGPRGANIAGRVMYRESDVVRWIDEQFEAEFAAAAEDHNAVVAGAG